MSRPPLTSRRQALAAAGLMLGGVGLAGAMKPTKHLADQIGKPDLETLFPKTFRDWRIDPSLPVILPAPDVQALLDKIYNQVLARTYVNAQGQRIMLSVAYGGDQSDGTSAHRPEVCYPAQGFAIKSNKTAVLTAGPPRLRVRLLESQLGGRYEPITYWVVVGSEVVLSGLEQKWAQMRFGLRGIIADGLLVRVSSIDNVAARAHKLQAQFIADLWSELPVTGRRRVFGEASAAPA